MVALEFAPVKGRSNVRFGPKADTLSYSITSSARPSTAGGIARPSALAVLRLTTNSYLVGAPARTPRREPEILDRPKLRAGVLLCAASARAAAPAQQAATLSPSRQAL